MVEFELVEDELRPENFREAMGRVRRILTIKINIPYSFIAAAIALYFGGLLVRLFKPFRIPLISHVTEDTGTNFIALSFFICRSYFCGSTITFIDFFASATSLNPSGVSFIGSLWVIISLTSIFLVFSRFIASVMSSPAPA